VNVIETVIIFISARLIVSEFWRRVCVRRYFF
jgi:hypothetical protein